MFYGATRNTFEKAAGLRKNMTPAEKILWIELRNRRVFKARFRRQHPVDIFVLDFYCHEYKLAVEIYGEIHLRQEVAEYDDGRTHDLEQFGIKVLRFTNNDIFNNMPNVRSKILEEISNPSTAPL